MCAGAVANVQYSSDTSSSGNGRESVKPEFRASYKLCTVDLQLKPHTNNNLFA